MYGDDVPNTQKPRLKKYFSVNDVRTISRLAYWQFQENVILENFPGWHLDPSTFLLKFIDDNESSDSGNSDEEQSYINISSHDLRTLSETVGFIFINAHGLKVQKRVKAMSSRRAVDPTKAARSSPKNFFEVCLNKKHPMESSHEQSVHTGENLEAQESVHLQQDLVEAQKAFQDFKSDNDDIRFVKFLYC